MSGKRKHKEVEPKNASEEEPPVLDQNDVDYLTTLDDEGDSSDSEYEDIEDDDELLVWEDGDEDDENEISTEGKDIKEGCTEQNSKPKVNGVAPSLSDINQDSEEDEDDDESDESESEEEEDDGVDSLAEDSEDSDGKESESEETSQQEKEIPLDKDSGVETDVSKDGQASTSRSSEVPDEYEYDSSDEEDLRNTIGNIPINWYDDYPHLGYDLEGKPILKPEQGDALDKFLNKLENPDFNRTVFDKLTGQEVRLSDGDLDIVKRIMGRRVPDKNFEMYPKFLDLFSHEVMEMPLSGRPEHKRSFIPSRAEAAYVARRALLIRRGLIKYNKEKKEKKDDFSYDLWHDEGTKMRGVFNHMPAPKRKLPGHGESYHPPPEYLPTHPKLLKERTFSCLRHVPAYKRYIQEQWDRCLNLYLAPRRRTMKIQASSTDLIPLLPKPQDLRPFPTQEAIVFTGHKSIIRTIAVHPLGKYLASGSDDHTVKIWEVSTGRCLRSFDVEGAVKHVSWNPSNKLFLLGIVFEKNVVFLNPETYLVDKVVVNQTNQIFKYEPDQGDYIRPQRVTTAVQWRTASADEWAKGYRIIVEHFRYVKQIVWHKQGDYFATVIPEGDHRSVLMHQLSRWRSQVPFNKCKGRVQTVAFHPKLPFLYVVTQSHIRVYNLLKQQMTKKVQANCRWVSSIAVHPGGEHFLIGGYDRKMNWFEMECTRRPHALRYHKSAIRSVAFHRKYPLFASAADEGRVVVSHGMVYNDWLKDPLLVPLKELKGHRFFDGLYVLDVAWHPYEPYIFTAGADATIRLWH